MEIPSVFVVSADAAVSDSVKDLVESTGFQAEIFTSLRAFLDAVGSERRGCLVLDTQIRDLSDPERQPNLAAACNRMPVVLIVDRGDVPTAVCAVKAGAIDIVQKPYRDEKLLDRIATALQADAAAHC
jgi:FixJ family two-component response regulator